jgi:hypothetical protein
MEKLPTLNSSNHEFTCFAVLTMKNTVAIQAIESHLNIMAEKINELIDRGSGIDLEDFKATFLNELATLLNQKTEFEFSNSLFDLLGTERTDLKECVKLLDVESRMLDKRISKIESALGHEKVEEGEKFDTCQPIPETRYNKIVLVDGLNRDCVADVLVAENVHPSFDKFLVELLNENKGSDESWFVLKPNDYRLARGMEDLI